MSTHWLFLLSSAELYYDSCIFNESQPGANMLEVCYVLKAL